MITRRAIAAGLATTLIALTRRAGAESPPPTSGSDPLAGNGPGWTVTAAPRSVHLLPGAPRDADVWALNGKLAPVFRLKQGADVRLSLTNKTTLPLSLHVHGVRGPNATDGVG